MCNSSFICFCSAPLPLELTIVLFHVIFTWTSCSFTPSRSCSHCCLVFMCLWWLVLCVILLPFIIIYVKKVATMKSNIGCCHHHHKGPASFCCRRFVQVSNVMPWPNCYGVFCLVICFSRQWSSWYE